MGTMRRYWRRCGRSLEARHGDKGDKVTRRMEISWQCRLISLRFLSTPFRSGVGPRPRCITQRLILSCSRDVADIGPNWFGRGPVTFLFSVRVHARRSPCAGGIAMDCNQVFMILTRGPFPTGELWDEDV